MHTQLNTVFLVLNIVFTNQLVLYMLFLRSKVGQQGFQYPLREEEGSPSFENLSFWAKMTIFGNSGQAKLGTG